jgi:hypothetical protein
MAPDVNSYLLRESENTLCIEVHPKFYSLSGQTNMAHYSVYLGCRDTIGLVGQESHGIPSGLLVQHSCQVVWVHGDFFLGNKQRNS